MEYRIGKEPGVGLDESTHDLTGGLGKSKPLSIPKKVPDNPDDYASRRNIVRIAIGGVGVYLHGI